VSDRDRPRFSRSPLSTVGWATPRNFEGYQRCSGHHLKTVGPMAAIRNRSRLADQSVGKRYKLVCVIRNHCANPSPFIEGKDHRFARTGTFGYCYSVALLRFVEVDGDSI
jgi:hypothetical protein